jgi:hypothetical protein
MCSLFAVEDVVWKHAVIFFADYSISRPRQAKIIPMNPKEGELL